MSGRRGFLKTLLGLPVLACFAPKLHAECELPIGSDLSFSSLQWAIDTGREWNFGAPRELIVGFDNWDAVERMVRTPLSQVPYFKSSDNFLITCSDKMERNKWQVVFERGTVASYAP
jgi:hypothetical protein